MTDTVSLDHWSPTDNIDRWLLVSAYCDRWCERCRHRSRCLMAGLGPQDLLGLIEDDEPEPTDEDLEAEARRLVEALTEGLEAEGFPVAEVEVEPLPSMDDDPLLEQARDWFEICAAWLASLPEALVEGEARELDAVLGWYATLVPNKLYRTLISAWFEERHGHIDGPHTQEVNGSAKVAALGLYACIGVLTRWCEAHRLDHNALQILLTTSALLEALQRRFPDHMSFRRPGFED